MYVALSSVALAVLAVFAIRARRRRSAAGPRPGISYVAVSQSRLPFRCGHVGADAVRYDVYGTKINGRFRPDSPKCPDCCVQDMRKRVIRCAACGRPIMPGDVVHLARGTFGKSEWITRFQGEMVFCNRSDCEAPNPAGRWTGETVDLMY